MKTVMFRQISSRSQQISRSWSIWKKLSVSVERIIDLADALKQKVADVTGAKDIIEESALIRDNVLPAMTELRVVCDEAETLTDRAHWPFPTYGELLFGVRN